MFSSQQQVYEIRFPQVQYCRVESFGKRLLQGLALQPHSLEWPQDSVVYVAYYKLKVGVDLMIPFGGCENPIE